MEFTIFGYHVSISRDWKKEVVRVVDKEVRTNPVLLGHNVKIHYIKLVREHPELFPKEQIFRNPINGEVKVGLGEAKVFVEQNWPILFRT